MQINPVKDLNTRLKNFVDLTKRRLVEDVLRPLFKTVDGSHPPPPLVSPLEQTPVSSLKTQKVYSVPTNWLGGLRIRGCAMQALGTDPVPLLLAELLGSVETASKVVLNLWTPLRSHWDFEFSRNLDSLIDSALWYVPMCGEEQQFIPFLKYQLSYLFAKAENQFEMPERKEEIVHKDGYVLIGGLGKIFKTRCFGRSMKNREFRNTVLLGIKKGMPQMGDFHLRKNLEAMKKRLTQEASTPQSLLDEVTRTTREIFSKPIVKDDWNVAQPWTGASTSASFERKRAEGGNLLYLRDLDEGTELNRHLQNDQLASMFWNPTLGTVGEIRWPGWTVERIHNSLQRFSVEALLDRQGSAKAKPIFEPFKVRMISAGDIISNGLFTRLQKALWKNLQKFDQFQLTGKTVEVEDILTLDYNSLVTLGSAYTKWVSGDYSAATDNLHTDATRACIDAIAGDEETRKVLIRGLQNTKIDFDSIEMENVPSAFEMKSGQLMGCVFSFPILCILNVAVYRYALERETGMEFTLRQLPCLVNGDDILFKTTSHFYQTWSECIGQIGFEKSVGKNYVSEEFAMINSTYFRTGKTIKKVPYLNMGWCTGVSKGGGNKLKGDHEEDDKSILRIKSQVEKTESDWILDPDYANPKDSFRRSEILERFKDEIHLWNWDRIKSSCVSADSGPAGLGLKNTGSWFWKTFAYYLYGQREKLTVHGLSSQAKSIAPWKAFKNATDKDDFVPIYQYFHKAMRKYKTNEDQYKCCEYEMFDYMIGQFRAQENEFMENRLIVGSFPKTKDDMSFISESVLPLFGSYESEYFARINLESALILRTAGLDVWGDEEKE